MRVSFFTTKNFLIDQSQHSEISTLETFGIGKNLMLKNC